MIAGRKNVSVPGLVVSVLLFSFGFTTNKKYGFLFLKGLVLSYFDNSNLILQINTYGTDSR